MFERSVARLEGDPNLKRILDDTLNSLKKGCSTEKTTNDSNCGPSLKSSLTKTL